MDRLTCFIVIPILFQLINVITTEDTFILNARSCTKVLDLNYEIIELDCTYAGVGQYRYEGPSTVKVLKLDRLMDSPLEIPQNTKLERIYIQHGDICPNINNPTRVQVHLADILCVSCLPLPLSLVYDISNMFLLNTRQYSYMYM